MKALSIRQPWAWLIVNGYKGTENRSWKTHYRGPVLIHASSRKPTNVDVACARYILNTVIGAERARQMPDRNGFDLGGIVGYTHIINCVDHAGDDPWFLGPKGFILSTSGFLPFTRMKGKLSFFETGLTFAPRNGSFVLMPE
ncbi:ASCH domain-containing protein, partial [Brenneria populi subsp. brevivirga]|uniref:ASCH domain-containing protein n=1 Tax=Brenneria populi TaxID=1505588 RepID=UPI002E190DCF|nr:ASCH domain-containing protein [Brenneria populi subsp. brevivirga]